MNNPVKALSIRQPWAWLITHGHKDIENRTWTTRLRGRIYIHASQGMTQDEYNDAYVLAADLGVEIPLKANLERGGIVGEANLIDCVSRSFSPWFFGPYGFVLTQPKPLPYQPCRGSLNFFLPFPHELPIP